MTTTTAVDSKWKFCPILCTKHYISWRFLLKKLSGYKNTSGVNCISSKKMILHRSVVFVVVVIMQKKKSHLYISRTGIGAHPAHSGLKSTKKYNLESPMFASKIKARINICRYFLFQRVDNKDFVIKCILFFRAHWSAAFYC